MRSWPTASLSRPPLVRVFATTPDPRPSRCSSPPGRGAAAGSDCGACGAKTLLAISEWIADTDRTVLARLGISTSTVLPCESTIRRTLAAVDADELDTRLGAWMATRTATLTGRGVIAVDGKSLRGSHRQRWCDAAPALRAGP